MDGRKFITIGELEDITKHIMPTEWLKIQNDFWGMIEKQFRNEFINDASKLFAEHINEYICSYGEDAWIDDNFIEDFKKAMQ